MSETEFEKFEPVEGIGYVPVSKGGNAFLIAGATSSRVGQIVVWLSDTPEKHKKAADRVRAGRWVVGPEFSAELDFDKQYATIEVIAEVRKANARAAQAEKDARKAQRQVKAALKSVAQPKPEVEPAPAPEPEAPVTVETEVPEAIAAFLSGNIVTLSARIRDCEDLGVLEEALSYEHRGGVAARITKRVADIKEALAAANESEAAPSDETPPASSSTPVSDDEAAQLMRDAKELLGEGVNY